METAINKESRGTRAILGIVHAAGVADMYISTLDRIFNAVLYNQDDMGMDDTEAISTLQALGLLRSDIQDIASDKDLAHAVGAAHNTDSQKTPTAYDEANQRSQEFDGTDYADNKLRAFLFVANKKAVQLMELINDITDEMQRMDRDKDYIDEVRTVGELALKAANITRRAMERESTRANDDQEGANE